MSVDVSKVNLDDLEHIDLQLLGEPDKEYLAVFIQDPSKPEQYWLRKMGVILGADISQGIEMALNYIQISFVSIGERGLIPCPANLVELNLPRLKTAEDAQIAADPKTREMHAVVGRADYQGPDTLSLEEVVTLVGIKYFMMRYEL